MQIVFIRHAKTKNSELKLRQGPDALLGTVGKKQATLLAKRLKKETEINGNQYDLILTSTWPRAKETALMVSVKLSLPLRDHNHIHEHTPNPILNNLPFDSDVIREFEEAVRAKGDNIDWKYKGGGESIREVVDRAKLFKEDLLANHLGRNYIVVSHGLFITSFLALLILGDDYTNTAFMRVYELLRFENTSITRVEYNEEKKHWSIRGLNDYSHIHQLLSSKTK